MYIIKKGLVRLTKTLDEKKVKIEELKEGEFFGEMSLLEDYPRSAGRMKTGSPKAKCFRVLN